MKKVKLKMKLRYTAISIVKRNMASRNTSMRIMKKM